MNHSCSSPGTSAAKAIVTGIPKACWCRAPIDIILSKSDRNPYRRFYRCSYAASKLLFNDNHVFKWVDEALIDEIEMIRNSIDRVEKLMMEQQEKKVMELAEKFVMEKAEHLVKERVEHLLTEKLDKLVTQKVEELLTEKVDNLVMEKVQEEILCMKL